MEASDFEPMKLNIGFDQADADRIRSIGEHVRPLIPAISEIVLKLYLIMRLSDWMTPIFQTMTLSCMKIYLNKYI